jgi:hypothetical protein
MNAKLINPLDQEIRFVASTASVFILVQMEVIKCVTTWIPWN